ncbi:hypothetical protein L1787_16705 [Acuticoccus sp. M5D2P5]|uniref:hypothetical protein n=1 Tax=Acuticoccus kalidii TaxID=2910977 RepID=UPI001F48E6B7|nr:hypothetical protein [Acuticoccus kalidii]MCF3935046.1 hypothetical protein [Acuticoccus kalidii]
MTPDRSDILDIEVQVHATSERAVKVSSDGDAARAVWLPLSQIEIATKGDGLAEVSLPEWLAIEKELA